MHRRGRTAILLAALWLGATSNVYSQVSTRVDSLNRALSGLSARIDSLEAGLCPAEAGPAVPGPSGDRVTDTLAAQVQSLERRLAGLRQVRCAPGAAPAHGPSQTPDSTDDLAAIRAAAAQAAGQAGGGGQPDSTKPKQGEAPPAQQSPRGANLLNPEISATGDIRVVAREGPQENTFVPREFEFAFQSALDPYSSTKIFMTFEDEAVGIEEGYIYWTGLPGRLRVDVGKYRQQVGDLNRWHLHALPETEYPLVYQRYFGEEGLSGDGHLAVHHTTVLSGRRHARGLVAGHHRQQRPAVERRPSAVLLGRLQNFWQLSRSTYAQLGVTGLGGNHDDADSAAGLPGSTCGSPIGRRRPAPAAISPSGPRAIASMPMRSASLPTGMARFWICRREPANAGSSAPDTITWKRRGPG